jgi:hypothetical protein
VGEGIEHRVPGSARRRIAGMHHDLRFRTEHDRTPFDGSPLVLHPGVVFHE